VFEIKHEENAVRYCRKQDGAGLAKNFFIRMQLNFSGLSQKHVSLSLREDRAFKYSPRILKKPGIIFCLKVFV
jgi:hypothetical protein